MSDGRWAGMAYADGAEPVDLGRLGTPVVTHVTPPAAEEPAGPEELPAPRPQTEGGGDGAPVGASSGRATADLMPQRWRAEGRPARTGWRGAVRAVTFGAVAPAAGKEEVAYRRDRAAVAGQWSGPKTVVVANPKGGSGKTPTTIGLAAAFGDVRGGAVCGWDNNETLGTLGVRTTPARFPTTAVDLLANLERFERVDARRGELGAFTRHQESGQFDVLVSDEDPGRMSQIGREEFARIHAVLCRYHDVIVVDTGNNPRADNFRAALDAADVLVIPLSWTADHVVSAGRLIDQLAQTGHDHLARGAITVVTGRPARDASTQQIAAWRSWYTEHTQALVEVPYDQVVASGTWIVWDELRPETRRAYLRAASAVADQLTALDQALTYRSIKEIS